jgi:hypothetical protein
MGGITEGGSQWRGHRKHNTGVSYKESWRRQTAQHTPKRHATPAPARTTPSRPDLLGTVSAQNAPTSTHRNVFCVIWVCVAQHPILPVEIKTDKRGHAPIKGRGHSPAGRSRTPESKHIMRRCYLLNSFDCNTTQRKLTTPDSQKGFKDNIHTQAPRDTRACPPPPHHTLTCCKPHAHPLLPTAMAFVSHGFVLVQVQVQFI